MTYIEGELATALQTYIEGELATAVRLTSRANWPQRYDLHRGRTGHSTTDLHRGRTSHRGTTYIKGELALLPLPDGRVHAEHHPVRVLALHEVVVPDDEGDQVRRHDRRPLVRDHAAVRVLVSSVTLDRLKVYRKEGSVLFNDALNTFYSEHSFSLSQFPPIETNYNHIYTHI